MRKIILLFFGVCIAALIGTILGFFHGLKIGDSLEKRIDQTLSGTKGSYSIYIKNLKTGQAYTRNPHMVYQAASLYKLWIMAEAYDQIQNGNLQEDEELSDDASSLNQRFGIEEETAEIKSGLVSFSVKSALTQMITISHNYAALLLSEKVKLSNVKNFLVQHGLKESKIGEDLPITTASDVGLFLEKLYKGELANRKYTDEMLELMKKQQLNDKLPKYLPKGTIVAHKTGEIDNFSHDAGIVYLKDNDYIIVVMSESDLPAAAEDRIAQISKTTYDYFSKEWPSLFKRLLN